MTGHLSPGDPPETSQRGPRRRTNEVGAALPELQGADAATSVDWLAADLLLGRMPRPGCCDPTGGAGVDASSSATEPSRKRLVRLGTRKPLDATNGSTGGRSPPEAQSQPVPGGSACTTRRSTSTGAVTSYASGRTKTTAESSPGVDARAARPRTCTAGDYNRQLERESERRRRRKEAEETRQRSAGTSGR